MKTLEQFWRWFDNEKPAVGVALDRANENLSELAQEALGDAADYVAHRRGNDLETQREINEWALVGYPEDVRKLSLKLCVALEEMHGAVPEVERSSWRPLVGVDMGAFMPGTVITSWLRPHGTREAGKSRRIETIKDMLAAGQIRLSPFPDVTWEEVGEDR